MDRFVSKRSSSSVDLDSSSPDEVRAERAAIALSVGLSWPPDRYTKQTRGRPSWQQLWERALSTTTSFRMVTACSARFGGDQEKPSTGRSHEELAHTKTPRAATAAPATPAAALVEDGPSGSASKRRKVLSLRRPRRSRLVPRHAGPVEERAAVGHAVVLVRGPASVPRDVRRDQPEHSLPLEAERATSRDARQENFAVARRHDSIERAHHAGHRRAVSQRGDDQSARMARRRGTRRPSRRHLGQTALAWHAPELQEARQVLERAPQP